MAQADLLLLNSAAGAEAVAAYRIAKTLAALPTRIASPVWAAVRPRLLARLRARDLGGLRRLLILPGLGMLSTAALAAPLLVPLSGPLVELAYGPSYASAVAPFRTLLLATWILGAVTGWLGFVFVITEEKRLGIVSYGLQLVLLIVLGWSVGRKSPSAMSEVVLTVSVVVAVLGWLMFMRRAAWFPERQPTLPLQ